MRHASNSIIDLDATCTSERNLLKCENASFSLFEDVIFDISVIGSQSRIRTKGFSLVFMVMW